MNEFFVLAFVITPMIVVALAYVAMRLHEREADRLGFKKRDPAE